MEVRAEECGESKRHLAMRWIEVEPRKRHYDLTRKRADFHRVFHYERT
jgi:hypothetical protein